VWKLTWEFEATNGYNEVYYFIASGFSRRAYPQSNPGHLRTKRG